MAKSPCLWPSPPAPAQSPCLWPSPPACGQVPLLVPSPPDRGQTLLLLPSHPAHSQVTLLLPSPPACGQVPLLLSSPPARDQVPLVMPSPPTGGHVPLLMAKDSYYRDREDGLIPFSASRLANCSPFPVLPLATYQTDKHIVLEQRPLIKYCYLNVSGLFFVDIFHLMTRSDTKQIITTGFFVKIF
jgi:hypothetical protein